MKRKEFIKTATFGGLAINLLSGKCVGTDKNNLASTPCDETPEETAGPFPTREPSKLVSKNIVVDRVGTQLTIQVMLYNINNGCKPLKDAIVDIWHCDHKGEYSEYGGSGSAGGPGGFGPPGNEKMPPPPSRREGNKNDRRPFPPGGPGGLQPVDHTQEHFLRGRQITDKDGRASFTSIYPGWYGGRAPHIHAQILLAGEKSLLITQIAFPEDINKEVYAQGVYADRGTADTTNMDDNVFGDGIANELAVVNGNVKDGFVLTHSIYVKA